MRREARPQARQRQEHFGEAVGIDVQLHACGPAHRACMAAMRNTHFYEMALIGPDMPNLIPPVYLSDYDDNPSGLDEDGCVPVLAGPGLGVIYDWDFMTKQQTGLHRFSL
jgi:L-alanine-DL-glutamate epimerase-like enolase superfamily enzyme